MKNLLFAIILFVSLFSFSQPIIINRTNYSVDQLVNQVLINSPCVSGLNVMSKNGNQFGSTNSIGYFENQNLNFPYASGVVLSTGAVVSTPGPNTSILSDGNTAWTGDTDLESNLLSQSGISIQSINASFIEFDFVPKTPLFDFSFLFASEEYGLSQCNFSDSFTFLLKDSTIGGSYTNLAVVPTTNTPISVITIRDSQYNSNCPSENLPYFGYAISNTTPITNTLSTFIYYSINDSSTANPCNTINSIPIQININKIPEPQPIDGAVCIDKNGNVVRNYTLLSRLSSTIYSFVWTNSLGAIVGTNSNLTVSNPDNYTVVATNLTTGCVSEPVTATVINSQKAFVSYTVSNAFDNNQIITVIATGAGNNYEYQIDGGPFQDSPIFENQNYVLEHTIVVRDKNDCGSTSLNAVVVNYPKLFTPNGDSYFDTWMVYGISQLKNVRLFIYNRYGKLLTQLNSKNESWDGTLNNAPLPADDYWFTISYTENGNSKEFRSHFTLKR